MKSVNLIFKPFLNLSIMQWEKDTDFILPCWHPNTNGRELWYINRVVCKIPAEPRPFLYIKKEFTRVIKIVGKLLPAAIQIDSRLNACL